MELSNYQIITLVLLIFDTYIVYSYIGILFNKYGTNKRIEFLSYVGYYLLNSFIFIYINMPFILLISNIPAYFMLSLNYKSSVKKKILSAVIIYIIHVNFRYAVALIYFGYSPIYTFSINKFSYPLWVSITLRIAIYIPTILLSRLCKFKKEVNFPGSLWLSIFLIPLVSIYTSVFILESNIIKDFLSSIASVIIILVGNYSAIYSYDVVAATLAEKYNQILISQQNEYYNNQFKIMKNSLKVRNREKHDLKNHLSAIDTLLHMNEIRKAMEHISSMMDLSEATKEYSSSGNVVIDSILNYKIQEAKQNGIAVNVELSIPECLGITSFDMTVILGNIIDNAINATKELEKDKIINLLIKYNKGRLIIKINNPFNGEVKYENNRLVTLHKDNDKHGIGINNVLATLEKYSGSMEIEHLNNIFSVMILMFV